MINKFSIPNLTRLLSSVLLMVIVSSSHSFAQLSVSGASAQQLVQDLVGAGITVSNVTSKGTIGSFSGGGGVIGIPDGVLLTTGPLNIALGPNNSGGAGGSSNGGGDPDLAKLAGNNAIFDAAVIEFDFTSTGDQITFRYVFGSEEYPEYVCSAFNDVFGFFISGPGANGNMAIIPGSGGQPVAINTINNGTPGANGGNGPGCSFGFTQYYVDGTNSSKIQYDGYTVVMETKATIKPCETYHMKIAIADAGDGILDSGVFLEKGSFSVKQPASAGPDVTVCSGDNAKIGGPPIAGYNYKWTPTQGLNNPNLANPTVNITNTTGNPKVTTYSLVATYGNNPACSYTDDIKVTVNPAPTADFTATSKFCVGGTSNINYTGSAPSGSNYSWDFKGGTVLSGSGKGPYVVQYNTAGTKNVKLKVTKNGCSSTFTVPIVVYPAPTPSFVALQTCLGTQTNIDATGTTGTISKWSWDFGNGTLKPNGSSLEYQTYGTVGTHTITLTVTDNNGCKASLSKPLLIKRVPTTVPSSTPSNCLTSDGTATVTASGGSSGGGYTYLWNDAAGQTTATATGLGSGSYTVVVKDPNGCTVSQPVGVGNLSGMGGKLNRKNVTCNGGNDGGVRAIPSGGTPPYTYTWTSIPGATTDTVGNLTAGQYPIVVTDANGCTIGATINITQPDGIGGSLPRHHVSCAGGNDGTATAVPQGGFPPYTYLYTNGQTTQTTATATGLTAGSYTITVHDSLNCSITVPFTMREPTPVTVAHTSTPPSCFSSSNGTATIIPGGGKSPYTYLWDNPSLQDTSAVTGLAAGIYPVTVTDSAGCTIQDTVVIIPPSDFNVLTSFVPSNCGKSDGTAFVEVNGATPGYTYQWPLNGSTNDSLIGVPVGIYSVTITDNNGCDTIVPVEVKEANNLLTANVQTKSNASCYGLKDGAVSVVGIGGKGLTYSYSWSNLATTNSLSGLAPGNYSLTITDSTGCTALAAITISEPSPFSIAPVTAIPTCGLANGLVGVTVTGATPSLITGYSYSWAGTGVSNDTLTGITGGTYNITVTDSNSCDTTIAITLAAGNPAPILSVNGTTAASCNGTSDGVASVAASLGNGNYQFLWTPSGATNDTVTGVPAGIYTVALTDAIGCTTSTTLTITEPAPINVMMAGTDTICIGQNAWLVADVNGGSLPYTFAWTPGNINNDSLQVSPIITETYTLTITDANGCTAPVQQVKVPVRMPLTIDVSGPIAICVGDATTIQASVKGGDGNYTYNWMPGAMSGASQSVSPATNTTYTVTVSDGCGTPAVTGTTPVTVNALPLVTITAGDTSGCAEHCMKFTNPSATIGTYQWDFGDGTVNTTSGSDGFGVSYCYNSPGLYTVKVELTDANNCKNSAVKNNYIEVYANAHADFETDQEILSDLNPTVSLTNLSTGSTTWEWDFGDPIHGQSTLENPNYTYADTGWYTITLTANNENNCPDVAQRPVFVKSDVAIYIPNAFTPNGDGKNDFFFASGIGMVEKEFWIYDRWGNEIAHITGLNGAWNGRVQNSLSNEIVQIDTYVYVYQVKTIFKRTQKYVGHVSVIR